MRFGGFPERVALEGELVGRAEARRAHYSSDGWTWRR
jgi:hypothetical protein